MGERISPPVPTDVIWVRLAASPVADAVHKDLATRFREAVVTTASLPAGACVSLVIVDDAHRDAIGQAADRNAGAQQSILITKGKASDVHADFVLSADVDVGSVTSVVTAAKDFHDQVMSLKSEVARRRSAVGTILRGEFALRTLDEARNLATMIAHACPNSDLVAIGLQELLINAVEHGNLEIDADMKQELLMAGTWREEVEARLQDPQYSDRMVTLSFQRSTRLISMTVQDEGAGFDHERYRSADGEKSGYRGRGIAMARDLSFSSLTYHGVGNVVEATILLEPHS
ncbi:ATP-binding protein [Maricaulis sp.]|uniref:ATP-binding protein n=1 Tax=Maricaulis sp. TaxID=1486257 RepID=UPI002B273C21|nr:ATP-binding protein [Maricaulis sp.]